MPCSVDISKHTGSRHRAGSGGSVVWKTVAGLFTKPGDKIQASGGVEAVGLGEGESVGEEGDGIHGELAAQDQGLGEVVGRTGSSNVKGLINV